MRKVSLIENSRPMTNSLAYLLCQETKRATDYRPGITPEGVRAVSEKSVRQHKTTQGRNAPFDCRRSETRCLAQVVRHQTRVSGLRDHTNSMTGDISLIQRDRIVAAL